MKKSIIISLLIFPFLLVAQSNEGKIIYKETIKLEIDIPEEHREQLKAVLPDSRSFKKVLIFNSNESIYKDYENQEDDVVEAGSEHEGMHIKMVMKRPDNQLYKNLAENKIFEKQEFFGRNFLITDETKELEWKLANEQKDILGYVCQKAIIDNTEKPVVAWFSPQIPVSNGPMAYGKLPGMILELDIADGSTHIVASEILLLKLEEDAIEVPKKGKKVSREEYDKIVEEKQKEMEEEYGGKGGRMIIRTRKG